MKLKDLLVNEGFGIGLGTSMAKKVASGMEKALNTSSSSAKTSTTDATPTPNKPTTQFKFASCGEALDAYHQTMKGASDGNPAAEAKNAAAEAYLKANKCMV